MTAEKVTMERDYKIVKHNDIIQKMGSDLSVQEQKVMLYIISKIKPDDEDFTIYEFKVQEFCLVCGINETSGNNYANIRAILNRLSDKKMFKKCNDRWDETSLRWIMRLHYRKKGGEIGVEMDNLMKPYLLQLKSHFTQYSLMFVLAMKSKYSIRLYELLKSYSNLRSWTVSVEELKTLVSAETYERYPDFKRKVIDVALREINEYSDLSVTPQFIKKGRKIAEISFRIKTIADSIERLRAWTKVENLIDG